jgi:hypothetical protein
MLEAERLIAYQKRNPEMFFTLGVFHVCLSVGTEGSIEAPFFEKHPELNWRDKFLADIKGNPWTLFSAKK